MREKPPENIVGKGENAGNQHFLPFPQYVLPFPKEISFYQFILSSANAFNLDQPKNMSFSKELTENVNKKTMDCNFIQS